MTAVVHSTTVATDEAEVLAQVATGTSALEAFLRDPIGYGSYDFADPISLGEFTTCRHHHGTFLALLT